MKRRTSASERSPRSDRIDFRRRDYVPPSSRIESFDGEVLRVVPRDRVLRGCKLAWGTLRWNIIDLGRIEHAEKSCRLSRERESSVWPRAFSTRRSPQSITRKPRERFERNDLGSAPPRSLREVPPLFLTCVRGMSSSPNFVIYDYPLSLSFSFSTRRSINDCTIGPALVDPSGPPERRVA